MGAAAAEVSALQNIAHARFATDSRDPGVVRQRSRGKLTCRERIAMLLDAGTFREVGSLAGFASYDDEGAVADFTPANHVGGWGKIDGRASVVCADDFTSRGGHADGAIGAKSGHLDRLSMELRIPSVRLLDGSSGGGSVAAMVPQQQKSGESEAKESSGAIKAGRPRVTGGGGSFLPGHLGSAMYAEQLSTVPVVNMLLGQRRRHRGCQGGARSFLGDGARHCATVCRRPARSESRNGLRDHERRSRRLAHPLQERIGGQPRGIGRRSGGDDEALPLVPAVERVRSAAITTARSRGSPRSSRRRPVHPDPPQTHNDLRRAARIRLWLMPIRSSKSVRYGAPIRSPACSFQRTSARRDASDSRHVNGGALTADGCDKLKRHLDLCDRFTCRC